MVEDLCELHIEGHFPTFSAESLAEHQRTRVSRFDGKETQFTGDDIVENSLRRHRVNNDKYAGKEGH